jgi:hypothetical protein
MKALHSRVIGNLVRHKLLTREMDRRNVAADRDTSVLHAFWVVAKREVNR